jgi:adenylate cyclase
MDGSLLTYSSRYGILIVQFIRELRSSRRVRAAWIAGTMGLQGDAMPTESTVEEQWYRMLMEGENIPHTLHRVFGALPSGPRCKMCNAPFKGPGGVLMHFVGRDQSRLNPRYCESCERFEHRGGAEIVLTMLFADVRGSTTLAERMSAREFSQLLNRFYAVATDVLVQSDAMVDKLVGDEVIGLFVPGMVGTQHPRRAIEAAQSLLRRTGHGDRGGPWLPVGVGVHTGDAYVGVVGGADGNPTDFTALGDNVNITARLASQAAAGEILISDAAYTAAGVDLGSLERRQLDLKGKSESTGVHVLRVAG